MDGTNFSYLTVGEINAIVDAFRSARGISYDQATRTSFMFGINNEFTDTFVPFSPMMSSFVQLKNDLIILAQTRRLKDNSVPLIQWLRYAADMFKLLPAGDLFEHLLEKVKREGEPTSVDLSENPDAETDNLVPFSVHVERKIVNDENVEEVVIDLVDYFQDISFLTVGARRTRAVAKIIVPRFINTKQFFLRAGFPHYAYGTIWLVASDLVLTNYHVIRNRDERIIPPREDLELQVKNSEAQFFFDAEGEEGVKIKVVDLIAFDAEPTRDFALLQLEEKMTDIEILPLFNEKVNLSTPAINADGAVTRVLAANIIQHPGGGPKRIAMRNNLIYKADYPLLHYYTDTSGGSSGSPVFDDTWRVIGLHRAAKQERTRYNGRTLGYVNEGVQTHAIMERLTELAQTDAKINDALTQLKAEQNL